MAFRCTGTRYESKGALAAAAAATATQQCRVPIKDFSFDGLQRQVVKVMAVGSQPGFDRFAPRFLSNIDGAAVPQHRASLSTLRGAAARRR